MYVYSNFKLKYLSQKCNAMKLETCVEIVLSNKQIDEFASNETFAIIIPGEKVRKLNGAKTDWIISPDLRHDVNGRFICNSKCDLATLRRSSVSKHQTCTNWCRDGAYDINLIKVLFEKYFV